MVQTERIEKKISSLYTRYGGYVSGSIVVLMSYIIQPEANAAAVQADTTADANLARQLHQQELYELRQRSRPKREWKHAYNTEISLLSDDEDIAPPLAKKQKQKQKQKKKSTNSSDDEEWLPKKPELPEE